MNNVLKLKLKSEKHALNELAKKNKIIKAKLAKLTERERQYKISADRLLATSKDARKVHSGINGQVLRERRCWSDRAMHLRFLSEEKLKVISSDLVNLNHEDSGGLQRMQVSQSRVNSIQAAIEKDSLSKKIRNEMDEFEEVFSISILSVKG